MADDSVIDPKENPESDGHLMGPGEIGGKVPYHDPTTTDTNDDPDNDPVLADMPSPDDQPMPGDRRTDNAEQLGRQRENPGPSDDMIGDDPTIGADPPL